PRDHEEGNGRCSVHDVLLGRRMRSRQVRRRRCHGRGGLPRRVHRGVSVTIDRTYPTLSLSNSTGSIVSAGSLVMAYSDQSPTLFLLPLQLLPLHATENVVPTAFGAIATSVAERCGEAADAVMAPSCWNVQPVAVSVTASGIAGPAHDTWTTMALPAACAWAV